MKPKEQLKEFRLKIKESICNVIIDLYKKNNNDMLPNFEDEEEFVITKNEVGTLLLDVEVFNLHDLHDCSIEKQVVMAYIVTLDNNLFFICGENDENEIEWQEISTDDLVAILDFLLKKNIIILSKVL